MNPQIKTLLLSLQESSYTASNYTSERSSSMGSPGGEEGISRTSTEPNSERGAPVSGKNQGFVGDYMGQMGLELRHGGPHN